MEELVRKSLNINSELREGQSTQQVMSRLSADLGGEAPPAGKARLQRRPTASGSGPGTTARTATAGARVSPASEQETRASNIAFFFNNKSTELEQAVAEIDQRRAALDEEQRQLASRTVRQVVDFLALATRSRAEAKTALRDYAPLLERLNVTAEELAAAADARRQDY